ncbi:hypothetical protein RchiOBHm_Chr3g0491181 [Rosa chinensis]|uniref:Uncharacterized protein n=1 Tax=Rosa chinensis TaxID=74649 RepID=A0A2P6RG56_ROSCH|nr:hypothetical protein RchiOBHm_Chr3g0491181 [Rosa chinensis]
MNELVFGCFLCRRSSLCTAVFRDFFGSCSGGSGLVFDVLECDRCLVGLVNSRVDGEVWELLGKVEGVECGGEARR